MGPPEKNGEKRTITIQEARAQITSEFRLASASLKAQLTLDKMMPHETSMPATRTFMGVVPQGDFGAMD
jgi:hypothetical protein